MDFIVKDKVGKIRIDIIQLQAFLVTKINKISHCMNKNEQKSCIIVLNLH